MRDDVWIVTGCSSGLGAAIARAAARRGARVVATARDPEAIAPLPDASPGTLTRLALDVTDRVQQDAVVQHVVERFGAVDVVVNNAGRMHLGAVEECTDAELRELFDLHVFAPTDLVRRVLPGMRARRRGTIVQMSSMGAFVVAPGTSSYTASKAALENLSATLAGEVAPFGIRVLIVEPGGHRTAVFSAARLRGAVRMPEYAELVDPIERRFREADGGQVGDPDRAANVIVDVVDAEHAPLRLPLGADAADTVTAAVRAIDAEIVAGAELAQTTAYPVPPGGTMG